MPAPDSYDSDGAPIGSELPDATLVEKSLAGNTDAFGELIKRHRRQCVNIASSYLRNRCDAEDQAQNAFVSAFQHLDQFQGQAEFSTWLTRILVNKCLMLIRLRQRARYVLLDQAPADQAPVRQLPSSSLDPEDEFAQVQLSEMLRQEIRRVPPLLRHAMILRDIEGLPMTEVAEQLGITVAAAKSRLVRARAELRSRMVRYPASRVYTRATAQRNAYPSVLQPLPGRCD